jgi:hypothetical protein
MAVQLYRKRGKEENSKAESAFKTSITNSSSMNVKFRKNSPTNTFRW